MAVVPADNPFGLPSYSFDNFITPGVGFIMNGADISTTAEWGDVKCAYIIYGASLYYVWASEQSKPNAYFTGPGFQGLIGITTVYSYDNKTVYYHLGSGNSSTYAAPSIYTTNVWVAPNPPSMNTARAREIAWLMVYGGYGGYSVTYDLENCTGAAGNPTLIPPNATVTPANFTVDEGFEFVSSSCWIDGDGFPSGTPIAFSFDPETGALRIGPVTSDITVHVHAYGDPYAEIDGEADLPGGGTVPIPGLPGLSAVSTGMLGLFAPSVSQMQLLADFMWTDFGGTGTTEVDVLKEIVQAIKRNISNPLDYVVGLNIIPSQGLSIGADAEVRFGFVNTGISMPRLTNQYFTVNCGTIYFPPVCLDTFLDYAPYSKFSIYLPYIGYKDLNANDCVGHTIGVVYHGDTVTGGITAYITKDGSVLYQYSGCCALTLPLSSDSWGTTISGALQVASALGVGVMSGGAAGIANAAINSTSSVAGNPSLLSPQVARSGAVSGGAGLMGVQHPVIIREAVSFHDTTGFNTVSGYPSWYYKQLADVSGYTTVVDVHLHNIPATQGEIEEIEQKLKEGVIL